jgi:ERCC4-type nuclease
MPEAQPAGRARTEDNQVWVPAEALRLAREVVLFEAKWSSVLGVACERTGNAAFKYRMEFRSSAFGLIIAMHRLLIGFGVGDFPSHPEEWADRARIMSLAAPFSRSPYTEAKAPRGSGPASFYTGESSFLTLKDKGLVQAAGRPSLFSLSPAGRRFAEAVHEGYTALGDEQGMSYEEALIQLEAIETGTTVSVVKTAARRGALHLGIEDDRLLVAEGIQVHPVAEQVKTAIGGAVGFSQDSAAASAASSVFFGLSQQSRGGAGADDGCGIGLSQAEIESLESEAAAAKAHRPHAWKAMPGTRGAIAAAERVPTGLSARVAAAVDGRRRRSGGISRGLRQLDNRLDDAGGANGDDGDSDDDDVCNLISDDDDDDGHGSDGGGPGVAVAPQPTLATLPSTRAAWLDAACPASFRVCEERHGTLSGAPAAMSPTRKRFQAFAPAGPCVFGPPLVSAEPESCPSLPRSLRDATAIQEAHHATTAAALEGRQTAALRLALRDGRACAAVVALVAANEPAATVRALVAAGVPVRQRVMLTGDIAMGVEVQAVQAGSAAVPLTDGSQGAGLFMAGYIMERKTVADLLGSIRSSQGRQATQQWFLSRCGLRRVFYIIEGNLDATATVGDIETNRKAVATSRRNAIAAGFSVIATASLTDTASSLAAVQRRLQAQVDGGWSEWLHPRREYGAWNAAMRALKSTEQTVGSISGAMLRQVANVQVAGIEHVCEVLPTMADAWALGSGESRHALTSSQQALIGTEQSPATAKARLVSALTRYAARTGTNGVSTKLPRGVSNRAVTSLARALTYDPATAEENQAVL